jgi:hypothetical protein
MTNSTVERPGISDEEERAIYAVKRRNAKIFAWILAAVAVTIFLAAIFTLARSGVNPFEEKQEEYLQEQP